MPPSCPCVDGMCLSAPEPSVEKALRCCQQHLRRDCGVVALQGLAQVPGCWDSCGERESTMCVWTLPLDPRQPGGEAPEGTCSRQA